MHGGSTTTRRIGRHVLGWMYMVSEISSVFEAVSLYPEEIISLCTTARMIRAAWGKVCQSKQNLRGKRSRNREV
jgi:hypothetical protein